MGGKNCKCEHCNCGGNNWVPCDEPAEETGYMFKGGEKVPIDVPSRGSKVFINTRQCGKTGIKTEIIKNRDKTTVIAIMSRWEFRCTMSYTGVTETVHNADELGFVCVRPPEYSSHSECVTAKPFYISINSYKNQSIVGKVKGVDWKPITFDFNIAHELMARGYSVKPSGSGSNVFYNYGSKELNINSEKSTGGKESSSSGSSQVVIKSVRADPFTMNGSDKINRVEVEGFTTEQIMGKWEVV